MQLIHTKIQIIIVIHFLFVRCLNPRVNYLMGNIHNDYTYLANKNLSIFFEKDIDMTPNQLVFIKAITKAVSRNYLYLFFLLRGTVYTRQLLHLTISFSQ